MWDEQLGKYIRNNMNIESKNIERTEALVFMLVSLKEICGLFFKTHNMSALILAELINSSNINCKRERLKIWAITCDGKSVNYRALEILSANIFVQDYKAIQDFFTHVTMRYTVRVILDPCHILNLAHNIIADYYKKLKINDYVIKWEYICQLHKKLTFKLKNRLSNQAKHVL